MDIDDLEFKKLIKENLDSLEDLELIFLKGHLVVEQMLSQMLDLHLSEPERINSMRLMFNKKLEIYLAIVGNGFVSKGLEEVLKEMNTLRNKLAHNLSHPDFQDELLKWIEFSCQQKIQNTEDEAEVRDKLITSFGNISAYFSGGIFANKTHNKSLNEDAH